MVYFRGNINQFIMDNSDMTTNMSPIAKQVINMGFFSFNFIFEIMKKVNKTVKRFRKNP